MIRSTYLPAAVLAAAVALVAPTTPATAQSAAGQPAIAQPAADRPAAQESGRQPVSCPAPPPADTTTPQGWLGYLAAHRGDVSLVIDDGRGNELTHRPATRAPGASASKVIQLAAYARAVALGRIDPNEQVRVGDWEAWYLPTDGGAHIAALDALGIPHDERGVALDPNRTVRLDDLAALMIRFSDSAAADYLRHRLGDAALYAAALTGGHFLADLTSFTGEAATLLDPTLGVPAGLPRFVRSAAEWALARRIAGDAALRDRLRATPLPDPGTQQAWAERTSTVPADGLDRLHRAISTGSYGPGSELARRHLEWPTPPEGVLGLGAKGGSLPGVLTEAMTVRRADGTTASAVLLVRRMPLESWIAALGMAHQAMLFGAVQDPALAARVRCSLSG